MNTLSYKHIAYTNWIEFARTAKADLDVGLRPDQSAVLQFIKQAPVAKKGLLRLMVEAAAYRERLTVVVDVDDTLLDTTPRSQAIAQYLIDHANPRLPLEAATLRALAQYVGGSVPHYFFGKALAQLGAATSDIARCEAAWMDQFFTDLWLDCEKPIAEAVEYMSALAIFHPRIIYLTGRDTPYMRRKTEDILHTHGLLTLHIDDGRFLPELITKPHYRDDDPVFKAGILSEIMAQRPEALALVENEPKNLRAMLDTLGTLPLQSRNWILLDTVRASDPKKELDDQGIAYSFPKDFKFPVSD